MTESQTPRDELNDLLNGAVEVASELLEAHGEFDPFALALLGDGKVLHLEPEIESDDVEAEQLVESLRATLRERLSELRACVIVADVTLEDEAEEAMTAAIAISMEHVADEPVACFVPYEMNGDSLELADLIGEPGERHVFPKEDVN